MFAINPFGPMSSPLAPGFGTDPFSAGFASGRLGGLDNPMLAGAGSMQQMMAYNEMAYQGLLMSLVQIMAGLMRQGGQAPPSGGSSGGTSPSTDTSGSSSSSSSGGSTDAGALTGGSDTGKKLAEIAKAEATNGDSSGGWCYRDVGRSLAKIGINVSGGSAYMAADQLAKNPKVKEVKVSQGDLAKLPAGAIVVWDRGAGHEHGHISIATGDGKEASDLMRNQITNYGTSFRVFMPV